MTARRRLGVRGHLVLGWFERSANLRPARPFKAWPSHPELGRRRLFTRRSLWPLWHCRAKPVSIRREKKVLARLDQNPDGNRLRATGSPRPGRVSRGQAATAELGVSG